MPARTASPIFLSAVSDADALDELNRAAAAGHPLVRLLRVCLPPPIALRELRSLLRAADEAVQRGELQPCAGPDLWHMLAFSLRCEIGRRRQHWRDAWRRCEAMHDGARWLASAARIGSHEHAALRRPGGCLLLVQTLPGCRVRASIVDTADSTAAAAADVLRLTWADTGGLIAQSMPNDFGVRDGSKDPS